MAETIELTCIRCPIGCQLSAVLEDGAVVRVSGNTCPRGEAYARAEVADPRRTVTGTVAVRGGAWPVTSVKTVPDVPKGAVLDVARALSETVVDAPLAIGDVVVANVCGTGADVVVTKPVDVQKGTVPFCTSTCK